MTEPKQTLDADSATGDTAEAQHRLEFDALAEIVAVQAQALNDVINSANNLQARVAVLEERLSAPVANGKKDNKIIRLQ